jgi:polyisoprenoid-binding protein YceI
MFHKGGIIFLFILIIAAGESYAQNVYSCENGKISFSSIAPLEIIKAESAEMRGAIDVKKRTFAFAVKMTSFAGFNAELQQEHFNENYLESEKFPEASFKGKIIEEVDFSNETIYFVRAKGTLAIHGVEQERIINVTVTMKENTAVCEAKFSVLLNEHNIAVPKVVHEKIASEVMVEVNAMLIKRKE